ncbi:MAG: hypothetical protein ACFE8L_12880 [Candidatus Hodarchaeota archaeon]
MVKAGKASEKSINISKAIIFVFFTIYLIVFGIIISEFIVSFQNHNPGDLPVLVSYIPLLCYIGALFLGIAFIIFIRNVSVYKTRQTQSRKQVKKGSMYKQALFLIIFIFAFVPLLAPIIDQGKNNQHFSIYNTDWNGCSDFRDTIEGQGYEIMSIQSSLSATERLDKRILLILMGPNQYYDPIFEIPYFIDFFNSTNSLLICHDHGSTSTLLWEILIASFLTQEVDRNFPLTIFPDGVLRDHDSYFRTAEYPVITDFLPHPTVSSGMQVVLGQSSSAVGGPFITEFGWDDIGYSSDQSFIDKNGNDQFDNETDVLDLGFMTGLLPDFFGLFPLGIYPQPVFMAKEYQNIRIFVSADASLFNNELIGLYDNRQFGINIVEWLTYMDIGGNKDDWIIVFDEAHIRPEYSRDLTSAGIYGYIMQYIIHLSTNPITAWIYPILAYYTLRKYLPKKDEKEQKKKAEEAEKEEEIAKFRTSSFFAQKIEWYRDKSKYGKALTLLYRRLERKLNTLLMGKKITKENVIDMVIAKEPAISKGKVKRIDRFMEKILLIKEGKEKIRNEQDFENLFFEMEWVVNNI